MANENGIALEAIQMGLESTAGTAVAATKKWSGRGTLKILDEMVMPNYATGFAGGAVEDAYIGGTGSELTLTDTDCSLEQLLYILNAGVAVAVGPAATFTFALPSTTPNTIKTWTWEMASAVQEYEFAYGFCTKFGISANAEDNGGAVKMNAVIRGRKATASTLTASLAPIASRETLNLRNASIKIDALGTAYGTAAATANYLAGFSLDVETGWRAGHYADSRTDKDMSVAEGGGIGYKISGELLCAFNATAVTEFANARAATGRILEINLLGSSSRSCKIQLPIIYKPQDIALLDQERDGLRMIRLPFESHYSRTTTAQAPTFLITPSASTTVA